MALWCLKGSVLYFFRNIQGARTNTVLGAVIILGSWLIIMVATFTSCQPFYKFWQIYPDPAEKCYASHSPVLLWIYLIANVATDVYLITIPIPALWRASFTSRQKAGFICLFGCTLIVTLIAIVRIVPIVQNPGDNADGEWAIREVFTAILTTNLPPSIPLLRRWFLLATGEEEEESKYVTFEGTEGRKSMKLNRLPPRSAGANAGKEFGPTSPQSSRSTRRDFVYPYLDFDDDCFESLTEINKDAKCQEEVGTEVRLEQSHSSTETKQNLAVIVEETA